MDRIDTQIRQRQQDINKAIRSSFKEDVTTRPAVEMTEEAFEKAVKDKGLEVYTIEGLNQYKQELLKAMEGKKFPVDQLEKSAKNIGALQKVVKTDKNGKKTTVYVKRGEDPKKERPAAKPEAAGQGKEGAAQPELSAEHQELINKKTELHKRLQEALKHEADPDKKAELLSHHTRLTKELGHLGGGNKPTVQQQDERHDKEGGNRANDTMERKSSERPAEQEKGPGRPKSEPKEKLSPTHEAFKFESGLLSKNNKKHGSSTADEHDKAAMLHEDAAKHVEKDPAMHPEHKKAIVDMHKKNAEFHRQTASSRRKEAETKKLDAEKSKAKQHLNNSKETSGGTKQGGLSDGVFNHSVMQEYEGGSSFGYVGHNFRDSEMDKHVEKYLKEKHGLDDEDVAHFLTSRIARHMMDGMTWHKHDKAGWEKEIDKTVALARKKEGFNPPVIKPKPGESKPGLMEKLAAARKADQKKYGDHYKKDREARERTMHGGKTEQEAIEASTKKEAPSGGSAYESHTNTPEEGKAVIARQKALLANPKSPAGAKKRAEQIIDAEEKKHGLGEQGDHHDDQREIEADAKAKKPLTGAEMRRMHEESIYGKTGRSKAAKQRYMNEEEREKDNAAREEKKASESKPTGASKWANALSTRAERQAARENKPKEPLPGTQPAAGLQETADTHSKEAYELGKQAFKTGKKEDHEKAIDAHEKARQSMLRAGSGLAKNHKFQVEDHKEALEKLGKQNEAVGPKKTIESQGQKAKEASNTAWGSRYGRSSELHAEAAKHHKEAAKLHREAGNEDDAKYHDKKAKDHETAASQYKDGRVAGEKENYDTKPGDSKADKDKKNAERLARMKELQGKLKSGKKGDDDVEKAFDTLLG